MTLSCSEQPAITDTADLGDIRRHVAKATEHIDIETVYWTGKMRLCLPNSSIRWYSVSMPRNACDVEAIVLLRCVNSIDCLTLISCEAEKACSCPSNILQFVSSIVWVISTLSCICCLVQLPLAYRDSKNLQWNGYTTFKKTNWLTSTHHVDFQDYVRNTQFLSWIANGELLQKVQNE